MFKYLKILLFIILCTSSCIKDTDFDQAGDVVLSPVIEANFLHFTIDINNFKPLESNTALMRAVDTTEIRFLNDSAIHQSLVRAEFYFKVTNTFPVDVTCSFVFYNEELNEFFYEFNFPVEAGNPQNPMITEILHTITGEEIEQLTLNDHVITIVEIENQDPVLEGSLNLQSKTIYFVEYHPQ